MPIDPIIGGAIVAGVGSLLSSIFTNHANSSAQSKSYRQNKNLMRYQFDLQQRGIDLANIYNLPQNQMKRLANAGLNPNLVYGSGVDGNQSSAASSGLGHVQAARMEMGNPIGDAVQAYYRNELAQSQIDSNRQGVEESLSRQIANEERTLGYMYDNRYKDATMDSRIAEQEERVSNLRAKTENTQQQTQNLEVVYDNLQKTGRLLEAKIATEQLRPAEIRSRINLYREQAATTKKQREVMDSIMALNDAKIMQLGQWCAESYQRTGLAALELQWAQRMKELGIKGMSTKDFLMILKDIIIQVVK